jgi:DNA modification methylase
MTDFTIHHGDCLDVLRSVPDDSVDAVVTDPPYGLSFMGKKWDYDVPGVEVWAECLRVLKPGGHLLAFAGTRTQHRMAVRIEDAGFEIRDMIAWVYGSGFPKSLDVSKAIDKAACAQRKVIGVHKRHGGGSEHSNSMAGPLGTASELPLTAPATPAAQQWQGWGTALKPALEPITVARKPLECTVAANVLQHGCGGLNVDGCRVGANDLDALQKNWDRVQSASQGIASTGLKAIDLSDRAPTGRWPANLIHDGSDEVVGLFPETTSGKAVVGTGKGYAENASGISSTGKIASCFADKGSAARFFYCAKASKADRDEGCEGLDAIHRANGNKWTDQDYRVTRGERPPSAESGPRHNHHPTVKPTELMRYLCRLVTPPGGLVLDPFTGSGSTGKAAVLEGFRFVGIEREAEYVEIAKARIAAAVPEQLDLL